MATAVDWEPGLGLRLSVDGVVVRTMAPDSFRRIRDASPFAATTVAAALSMYHRPRLGDQAFDDLCEQVHDVITRIHRTERTTPTWPTRSSPLT